MTTPDRPSFTRTAAPRPPLNRPAVKLPPGYSPNSSLPPNYRPPLRGDLQRSGALARSAGKIALSRRQILLLVLGGVGLTLAIMLVAAFGISALLLQNTVSSPETTLDTYYSAVRTQDYPHAYAQFSPSHKANLSETEFTSRSQQLDTLGGPVVSFSIERSAVSGSHASATVQLRRNGDQAHMTVDTVTLTQINGSWYIDTISSQQEAAPATPGA